MIKTILPEEDAHKPRPLIGPSIPEITIGHTIERSPTDELSSPPGPSNSTSAVQRKRTIGIASRFGLQFDIRTSARFRDSASLLPPSTLAQTDKQILAFQVLARPSQLFGVLLLTPSTGNIVAAHRRVVAESLVTVQAEGIAPAVLDKPIDSVHVLDVP